MSSSVGDSLEHVEHVPDPEAFGRIVELMTAYVRRDDGAWTALMQAAETDPRVMTQSLTALGAVLLDISAGAFSLTPDEMLVKVSNSIHASVSPPTSPTSPTA